MLPLPKIETFTSMSANSTTSSPEVSKYRVFISHAEEDKATIAIPLRKQLLSHGVATFVDETDLRVGDETPDATDSAMEVAEIAVFVLSPEFVSQKQTMKELLYFLKARKEKYENQSSIPVVIPFYYRLSASELLEEPRLNRLDSDGKSLYQKSRFLERMSNGEPEANFTGIKAAFQEVNNIRGVRNYVDAANDSSYQMSVRRGHLLDQICQNVLDLLQNRNVSRVTTTMETSERKELDAFYPYFEEMNYTAELVFDFEKRDKNGAKCTQEGRLLELVLDDATDVNRAIAIHGISGVGKTSVVQRLLGLEQVKIRFRDGVFYMSLGMHAKQDDVIRSIIRFMQISGGQRKAYALRNEKDLREVVTCFRSWFAMKQCLFLVDDIWESEKQPDDMISVLWALHEGGRDSKVLVTTCSLSIAALNGTYFCFEPMEPLGYQARTILIRYSGTPLVTENIAQSYAVTKILKRCCGLPRFLEHAGRTIRMISGQRGPRPGAAYEMYASSLDVDLHVFTNSGHGLYASLALSTESLDDSMNDMGFNAELSSAETDRDTFTGIPPAAPPANEPEWCKDLGTVRKDSHAQLGSEPPGLSVSETKTTAKSGVSVDEYHNAPSMSQEVRAVQDTAPVKASKNDEQFSRAALVHQEASVEQVNEMIPYSPSRTTSMNDSSDDNVQAPQKGSAKERPVEPSRSVRNAFVWYRAAAERGDPSAWEELGKLLQCDSYFQSNADDAVRCWKRAALRGDARGKCCLGLCYVRGFGVRPDPDKGLEILRQLAGVENDGIALRNLAWIYHHGAETVSKNLKEAEYWDERATTRAEEMNRRRSREGVLFGRSRSSKSIRKNTRQQRSAATLVSDAAVAGTVSRQHPVEEAPGSRCQPAHVNVTGVQSKKTFVAGKEVESGLGNLTGDPERRSPGVQSLITLLKPQQGSAGDVERYLMATVRMCSNNPHSQREAMTSGAAEALARVLYTYCEKNASIVIAAAKAMTALVTPKNPSAAQEFSQKKAQDYIVRAMKKHADNVTVQANGSTAIAAFCESDPRIVSTLLKSGISNILVVALQRFLHRELAVVQITRAMRAITDEANPEVSYCFKKKLLTETSNGSSLPELFHIALSYHMQNLPGSAKVIVNICATVNRLCMRVVTFKDGVGDGGIVEELICLVHQTADYPEIGALQPVLATICTLVLDSDKNKNRFHELGGIKAILDIVQEYGSDTYLLEHCCAALRYSCTDHYGNCIEVKNHNGVRIIMVVMTRHSQNVNVMMWCCLILAELCKGDEDVQSSREVVEGIDRVIHSMKTFAENHRFLAAACEFLRAASLDHEENQRRIVRLGGRTAIVTALEAYPGNDTLTKAGSYALIQIQDVLDTHTSMDSSGSRLSLLQRLRRIGMRRSTSGN